MDVSVLIPTYQRPRLLARCVAALARQTSGVRFEVVIGLDGPDEASERAAREAWTNAPEGSALRVLPCERAGYTVVRNQLIAAAAGRVMLSLNDDVAAAPDLVFQHWRAHSHHHAAGEKHIIVGNAPYVRRSAGEMDTLLDRVVRETSMVFFYDVMNAPENRGDPERNWGFRHCYGLNFSADLACVRQVGGFLARPHVYGYDDIELGYRLSNTFGMRVVYRPEAVVQHEHFYTAASLLERERSLGRAAWLFAEANPAFAQAVFGRDIRSGEELAYTRAYVEHERRAAERSAATLASLERVPADAVTGAHAATLIRGLYEQHLPAKRWYWRSGLLEASAT